MDKKNGARRRVPKLLFVLTDGRQSDPKSGPYAVENVANELKALGVHIFVVVIGDAFEEREILKIASTNNSMYYSYNMVDLTNPTTLKLIQKLTCPHLGKLCPSG